MTKNGPSFCWLYQPRSDQHFKISILVIWRISLEKDGNQNSGFSVKAVWLSDTLSATVEQTGTAEKGIEKLPYPKQQEEDPSQFV